MDQDREPYRGYPPPREAHEERSVVRLSLGSRLSLVAGVLLLIAAAYLFWGPIGHDVAGSFPAKCGSAAKPPHDDLGKAVCGSVNDVRRWQAAAMLAAGVTVAVGGVLSFGVTRISPRQTRPTS